MKKNFESIITIQWTVPKTKTNNENKNKTSQERNEKKPIKLHRLNISFHHTKYKYYCQGNKKKSKTKTNINKQVTKKTNVDGMMISPAKGNKTNEKSTGASSSSASSSGRRKKLYKSCFKTKNSIYPVMMIIAYTNPTTYARMKVYLTHPMCIVIIITEKINQKEHLGVLSRRY